VPAFATATEWRARAVRSPSWRFFREFLKHPLAVGSVVPSSRRVVDRMLAPVDWRRCRLFVEYGPGVGVFTRRVLEQLRPDATLLAIDTDPAFIDYLGETIADPRLLAVTGSAADIRDILARHGVGPADYVLSGLPFSTLTVATARKIADDTAASLSPGGIFLVYQLSSKVRRYLTPRFGPIDEGFEWVNIPPLRLFWAQKQHA